MNQSRWTMLAVLFAARTVMGFQFQAVASSGPLLTQSLAIDNAQLGLLIGLYLLPGLPIALPGGMVGQRFGAKRIAMIGLMLMAVGGAVTGVATSYPTAAAGRLVAGTGAVLINVMLTKLLADWFNRQITTAMAILVTSWPFGIAIGLVLDHGIAVRFGAGAVFLLSACLAAVALGLMATIYRNPQGLAGTPATRLTLGLTGYELGMTALTGSIWAAYNASYIVLVSFASPFFTARGFSIEQSSWIASLLGWFLIPMIPAGGYLVERIGRPGLTIAVGFVATAVAIVAMSFSAQPLPWLIAVAILGALPSGGIMALAVAVLRPEVRATGMGVYYTLYYAGVGVLPSLAGIARDRTGDPAAPLLVAAFLLGCALLVLAGFLAVQARRPSGNLGVS